MADAHLKNRAKGVKREEKRVGSSGGSGSESGAPPWGMTPNVRARIVVGQQPTKPAEAAEIKPEVNAITPQATPGKHQKTDLLDLIDDSVSDSFYAPLKVPRNSPQHGTFRQGSFYSAQ
jgi:hypothetical protein